MQPLVCFEVGEILLMSQYPFCAVHDSTEQCGGSRKRPPISCIGTESTLLEIMVHLGSIVRGLSSPSSTTASGFWMRKENSSFALHFSSAHFYQYSSLFFILVGLQTPSPSLQQLLSLKLPGHLHFWGFLAGNEGQLVVNGTSDLPCPQ